MKRSLIFVALLLASAFAFVLCASAQEFNKENELLTYVEEKIIPIIIGVITSIMALIGTLKGIFKALNKLEGAKDSFDLVNEELTKNTRDELEKISQRYEELKEKVKGVSGLDSEILALKDKVEALILQISTLSKIASLGFLQNEELVKNGVGREIAILAKQNEEEIKDEEL